MPSINGNLAYIRNIELAQEVDDDEMNTDHAREPVGDEFINCKRLYTSKRLPTTHTAYSITNRSGGSTICHVYTLSKSNAVDLL